MAAEALSSCDKATARLSIPSVPGVTDTHAAGDMVGAVPEEKETRGASRYDAIIATFVGFMALCVSGYTAYMQRQQVRAAVWPILESDSSNAALEKILGPGEHLGSESDMSGRVLAAGESMTVSTPRDPENNPLNFDKSNPFWVKMNKERLRLTVEICYCSTLDECWTLRAGGL